MEVEVGEGGTYEENSLVCQPATCDDGSSHHHQIGHVLPWKRVEDALLNLS